MQRAGPPSSGAGKGSGAASPGQLGVSFFGVCVIFHVGHNDDGYEAQQTRSPPRAAKPPATPLAVANISRCAGWKGANVARNELVTIKKFREKKHLSPANREVPIASPSANISEGGGGC